MGTFRLFGASLIFLGLTSQAMAQWNKLDVEIDSANPTGSPYRCWHKIDNSRVDDALYLDSPLGNFGFCSQFIAASHVLPLDSPPGDNQDALIFGYADNFYGYGDSIGVIRRNVNGYVDNNPARDPASQSSLVMHFQGLPTAADCPDPPPVGIPCDWRYRGGFGAGLGVAKTPVSTKAGFKYFAIVVVSYYHGARVGHPYDADNGDMWNHCTDVPSPECDCAKPTSDINHNPESGWLTWAVSSDGLTWSFVSRTGGMTTDPRNSIYLLSRTDRHNVYFAADGSCPMPATGRWKDRIQHVSLIYNKYDNYFYINMPWHYDAGSGSTGYGYTWWRMQFDPYHDYGLGPVARLTGANVPPYTSFQWVDAACTAGAAGCGTIPAVDTSWVQAATYPNSSDPHTGSFIPTDAVDFVQLYDAVSGGFAPAFGPKNFDSMVLLYNSAAASNTLLKGASRLFPFFDTTTSPPKVFNTSVIGAPGGIPNRSCTTPPTAPAPITTFYDQAFGGFGTSLQQLWPSPLPSNGAPYLVGYVGSKRTDLHTCGQGAGLEPVHVVASNTLVFPTTTGIAPASGPAGGGTAVTISGSNFQIGATVKIGSGSATVQSVGATTITATTPAVTAGTVVDVTVTNSTQKGVLWDAFLADFTDVPLANVYHADVVKIARTHITAGCGGGNYCPTTTPPALVTRDQMAAFLLKAKYNRVAYIAPPVPPSGTGFSDVPPGDPFAPFIVELAREGVTAGCGSGQFCPHDNTTRAQMAVFLLKAKNGSAFIPPAATGTIFADVHTGDFAADWIEEAYHEGIMFGGNSSPTYELCTTGNFCPNVNVVRGPMAPFLVRAFGL